MSDSEALRRHLGKALLARPLTSLTRTDPALVERLVAARQRLVPPRGHRALPRIAQGILAFRLQGARTPWPDLKYACYGIARRTDWEGRLLLDDPRTCDALLDAVAALAPARPRAFAACCKGLRTAWNDDITPASNALGATAQRNASRIAEFLRRHSQMIPETAVDRLAAPCPPRNPGLAPPATGHPSGASS